MAVEGRPELGEGGVRGPRPPDIAETDGGRVGPDGRHEVIHRFHGGTGGDEEGLEGVNGPRDVGPLLGLVGQIVQPGELDRAAAVAVHEEGVPVGRGLDGLEGADDPAAAGFPDHLDGHAEYLRHLGSEDTGGDIRGPPGCPGDDQGDSLRGPLFCPSICGGRKEHKRSDKQECDNPHSGTECIAAPVVSPVKHLDPHGDPPQRCRVKGFVCLGSPMTVPIRALLAFEVHF